MLFINVDVGDDNIMKDLWHDFWISAVEGEWQECVDENANKLNHLQPGQVPGKTKTLTVWSKNS